MVHTFYKDKTGWYIDLPEVVSAGIYDKANLAMVCGADTLLDQMAGKKKKIVIEFSDEPIEGYTDTLINTGEGRDEEALEEAGHPIQDGGYYLAVERNHPLWLCEVASYLFSGFPKVIYVKKIK